MKADLFRFMKLTTFFLHRIGGTYPPRCDSPETCIRGWNYQPYQWAFFYAIIWAALIYIAVTQWIIYKAVLNQEKRTERFSFRARFSAVRPKNRKKSRRVMVQSLLYVGALFVGYSLPTIFRVHYTATKETNFHLLKAAVIVTPLQGVWNCLIYLKPRFDQWRRICLKAKKEQLRDVCLVDKVSKVKESTRTRTEETQKMEVSNNSQSNVSNGGHFVRPEEPKEILENKRESQNSVQLVRLDAEQDEGKFEEEVKEDGQRANVVQFVGLDAEQGEGNFEEVEEEDGNDSEDSDDFENDYF